MLIIIMRINVCWFTDGKMQEPPYHCDRLSSINVWCIAFIELCGLSCHPLHLPLSVAFVKSLHRCLQHDAGAELLLLTRGGEVPIPGDIGALSLHGFGWLHCNVFQISLPLLQHIVHSVCKSSFATHCNHCSAMLMQTALDPQSSK